MTIVYAALKDLFFSAKISGTANRTGATVTFFNTYEEIVQKLNEQKPDLFIVDLNGFLTPAHVSSIRGRGVRTIGYLSHVQTELRNRFNGTCEIMTQSQFAEKLPELMK